MTVVTLERDGAIAQLTIRRPGSLNALGEMGDGDAFAQVCAEINADRSLRAVILTGEGRAFSAGGDLKAMQGRTGAFAGSAADVREGYRTNIHKLLRAIHALDVPLIAAVNGPAIGLGCDIACMADVRIAAQTATFGVTFLKVGLVPGDGGAWLLPRAIGMSRAAELFFTGRTIDADTAASWGLVSRVVPPDDLLSEARVLASAIAEQPPHALRATKMLLRQGQTLSYDAILELSAATQGLMHHTEDHSEGVSAVLERRKALFSGR